MKLYLKIMMFVLLVIAAALWANIYFSRSAVSEAMTRQIAESGEIAAAGLQNSLRLTIENNDEQEGLRALHAFAKRTDSLYAAIVLPDGKIVAHTNVALVGKFLTNHTILLQALPGRLAYARSQYITGKAAEEVVESALPITPAQTASGETLLLEGVPEAGEPIGFLLAGLPLAPALKAETDISLKLLVLALGIAAAALLVSALFVRLLLRQVALLGEGILKVRSGNYDVSVPVVSDDELGEVATSFNKLSRGLAETTVSKQYLDSLIESMPDPLIITDERGTVLRANRAASLFSGHDFSAPGGLDLRAILEPETEGAPHPYDVLSKGAHIRELDLLVVASDGHRRPAMLSAAAAGREIVVVLKDTTQHKQSQVRISQYLREVERVNSELDAFAHTVSHDLKEPLRGIEMFSGMLLSDYAGKLDPQAADYLSRVAKAAARMRRLIEDLLGYARIARVRNPYEKVSSSVLAQEAVAGLSVLLSEKNASVILDPDLPEIFCDAVKMRQVFHNLVSNAVKYNTAQPPKVRISAELFGQHWKFTVSDNGIGVPLQYAEEIFKMFKRLHSRHEFGGGTGAGLAIVQKIIEEHSGRVWVDSEEGKGSSFRFIIPAVQDEMPEENQI